MGKNEVKTVAVMGVGWVGGALVRYFEQIGLDVRSFDPPKNLGSDQDLEDSDLIFISVPTPFRSDGLGFDLSYVEDAVSRIPKGKTAIIKSTVVPGTVDRLQARYPETRLLFNPEFLREATADEDMRTPDRQILGVTDQSVNDAERVMRVLPEAPFSRIIPAIDAETVKYFGNCFLAIKVVYANQLFDVCRKAGADYDQVKECAAADPRIGESHLRVDQDGYRGYGGNCFPKDVRAFIEFGESLGIDLELLKVCERLNEKLRQKMPA